MRESILILIAMLWSAGVLADDSDVAAFNSAWLAYEEEVNPRAEVAAAGGAYSRSEPFLASGHHYVSVQAGAPGAWWWWNGDLSTVGGTLAYLSRHRPTSIDRHREVQSVLGNEPDPQLKPPTDPVAIEQDDFRLLIALGALAVLALGALLAWLFMRWWNRRERPEPAPPPPPPPVTTAQAYKLLNQATFGATPAEAQRVIGMGVEAWIDNQLGQPASLHLPQLQGLLRPQFLFELQPDRVDIWFRHALHSPDQLRQRVAFALSEVLVVSQLGVLGNMTYSMADYYDVLATNAFGNYRDLLEEVTLHPAMGVYLSMLGNEKPDAVNNIRPDENYAREILQLFTMGEYRTDNSGVLVKDRAGNLVQNYTNDDIKALAMAIICCSPPEQYPASRLVTLARRGK